MFATLITDSAYNLGFTKKLIDIKSQSDTLIFSIPIQYTLENRPIELEGDNPAIGISHYEHDFKSIKLNNSESVEVRLSNWGSAPLEIEKIESNCSCLTYSLSQTKLNAGESVVLEVQFNAQNRAGFERKTLAIFSNDPKRPTAIITFKAQIK
jgi:hypothetical protein